ncbi:hypothetical protein Nepgr_022330 [Nepenthes gracilis]|uniref:Uncharacterized protein n=1 Tax=Nepenthes gracilis TaxID=150966 RepID=A0AAD3XXZ0_NEPGR|nr:hypothetical protein Nepgr_022330 [Nepenthes gracilis]
MQLFLHSDSKLVVFHCQELMKGQRLMVLCINPPFLLKSAGGEYVDCSLDVQCPIWCDQELMEYLVLIRLFRLFHLVLVYLRLNAYVVGMMGVIAEMNGLWVGLDGPLFADIYGSFICSLAGCWPANSNSAEPDVFAGAEVALPCWSRCSGCCGVHLWDDVSGAVFLMEDEQPGSRSGILYCLVDEVGALVLCCC